ncbi:Fibronectin type III domain-containing protein [Jatrophihabitans endophyticus]|uniref:Fibronectin type III domain-containing protein n=1 Tax=Jatrophihabitans endophyticus TaxID=1206085 RepID=A0A1M5PCG8_9ACTN|nr:Ig-like domain-containing protein [Jatrophihabitans endophyticus]SHG99460.1 Fibronectin type III domain-containing protein [Jatrophihabitans endophyticus]
MAGAVSFARRHRGATAVGVVVALVAGVLVALALTADGYESRHVDLNDGGIWVTSNGDGLFGRLNKPAGSLDLALNPPGGAQSSYRLDVRQAGAAVAAWDQGSGRLLPVDVTSGKADADQAVPVSADEDVEIAGGTVAVLDAALGKVWAKQVDETRSLTSLADVDPSAKPALTFPKRDDGAGRVASLAVGGDGTLYAANSSGDVAVAAKSGLRYAKPTFARVAGRLESVQVTAVGSQVVVLDAKQGELHLPGGRTVQVPPDADARLQAPADSGDAVVLATRSQLLSVPLRGGTRTTLYAGGTGRPATPTWLGDCVHAAWAGEPGVYARACGGAAARRVGLPSAKALVEPVFRVNRGAILLNDLTLGNVYDLDSLQEVDNWSAVKPPPRVKPSKNDKNNQDSVAARDQPPKAVDDTWGARPGRTTVLHVLDNDSDPQGAILSINRLGAVNDPSASATIAPDGQSVEVTLPATAARDVQFKYTIDDGKGLTAEASVDVQVRQQGQNEPPRKRHAFRQQSFTASSGGTLDLPVLDDWRDFDGDPLVITTAKVEGTARGAVTIAPSGRLNYVASAIGGSTAIDYTVSDGSAAPVTQQIPLTVLAATSDRTAAPVAQPDIARGQVGKPITIKPLANDLPGADPTNPSAELGVAGTIASPAGAKVDTDLKSGTVTVTASRHGTFALSYTASFGNAKFDHAPIRVDVSDPPASAQPPVAVPDTGVLYGQTATTTDVLANDHDPAGGVLVVQRAVAADPEQLQVSVVDGRFLRVGAREPELADNPQVVKYTITNGTTAPVTGELTLTQVPPPPDDTPLAIDDYATVRSGDTTLVPALDNDIDPAGASLELLDDVPGAPNSGALTVTGAEGRANDPRAGAAFVSGKQVRYVAPAVTRPTTVTVNYVARNPGGDRATGTVHVTVTPPPSAQNPDQAPAAEPVSSRVVSGQSVRIKIPTTGVDPDGDVANVIGISAAPTLGRVTAIGATTITYEAFPTTSGTDRFGYIIADKYGKTSRSTIAVGVAQVSDPQPPTAVDDTVTASPGAKVRVDVLANDVVAPDDSVAIGDLGAVNPDLPTAVRTLAATGPVQVTAPRGDGQSVDVRYSVTDGAGDPSLATVTVRSQRGYVPPPSVQDVPAAPKPGAATTTVNVLKAATDPQGLPLRVAKVYAADATVRGGTVTLPVTGQVRNVVYVVANSQGGTAAAVVHVPARGSGVPYAKADQLITIGIDKSKTIDIADYVVDPAGKPLRLTTTDQLSAAPRTGLTLTSTDPTHLRVQGVNGYNGPAAITFEVTDGRTLNDPAGQLALITVPVQVGPNTPVIRCPSAPLAVVEGGPDRRLDIASLCHVWLADRSQLGDLDYTASWTRQPKDVDILGNGSSVIGLHAGGSAVPGQTGTLRVGVKNTRAAASSLNVTVTKLGRASMNPIRIDGFKAGGTVTRDIRGSVDSPLRDPRISVVRVTKTSGQAATVTRSGSRVSITPGANSHGIMTFDLVGTDVADTSRVDRQFTGRITLEVLNVPDAPGAPQAGRAVLSQTVVLSWPTPAANGAQIDRYQVGWSGGSQTCAASPCRITGLTNGREYAFTVRAHNAVGLSKPSPRLSPPAKPDKLPAAVTDLRTSNPKDGAITVSWRPVANGGSATRTYRVSWSGGGSASVSGSARSVVARGLDNHNVYTFTVVAVNELGAGPPASTRGQSAGAPGTPANVQVGYADSAGTDTRAVRVTWNASDPNGPTPATYTATRDGTPICRGTTQTSCNDTPATGKTYTYRVVATNGADKKSAAGASKPFVVAGTPDTPPRVSATPTDDDGALQVTYTVPNPHGQKEYSLWRASSGQSGRWDDPPAAGSNDTRTVTGLPNDSDITISVKSCNEQNCGNEGSGSGHTNGPPRAPGVSCSRSGEKITWTWNKPDPVNGHQVARYQLGGESTAQTTQLQYSRVFPRDSKSHTLTVTSIDDRNPGHSGGQGSDTCKAEDPPAPPNPTVTWKYSSQRKSGCSFHGGGNCPYADITGHDFSGSVTCTVYWSPSGSAPNPGGNSKTYTVTLNSGNNYNDPTSGYFGYTATIHVNCSNGASTTGTW